MRSLLVWIRSALFPPGGTTAEPPRRRSVTTSVDPATTNAASAEMLEALKIRRTNEAAGRFPLAGRAGQVRAIGTRWTLAIDGNPKRFGVTSQTYATT